jgi:hypothetical protein
MLGAGWTDNAGRSAGGSSAADQASVMRINCGGSSAAVLRFPVAVRWPGHSCEVMVAGRDLSARRPFRRDWCPGRAGADSRFDARESRGFGRDAGHVGSTWRQQVTVVPRSSGDEGIDVSR